MQVARTTREEVCTSTLDSVTLPRPKGLGFYSLRGFL